MSSTPPTIPTIFAPARRRAARARMAALQSRPGAAGFVLADMVEDVVERLAFLRHDPARALLIGDRNGELAQALGSADITRADAVPGPGEIALDEEVPFPVHGFDLIASLSAIDTVNDLPGALIHIRRALAPGGLAIVSFVAAGSLPALRAAMLAADGERPAARLHPAVDVSAGARLLQRAGFVDPVADSRTISVAYRSLDRLVADLREQGLGNVLANPATPLGKAARERARAAFLAQGQDGRVVERFELVTLSGRAGRSGGAG